MFGGSVCASADLLPPAGEGWRSLAAVRDGNAIPLGLSESGEIPDTNSLYFRCRWPSLAGPWSGSEKRSRDNTSTIPVFRPAGHAAQDGRKFTARREPAEDRQSLPAPIRETPVRAEGHCTGARQKSGLFFWTGPRPVFFSTRLKRKWGAESIAGHRQIPRLMRRFHVSHSPLWASHHAWNAGSFGERVGRMSA